MTDTIKDLTDKVALVTGASRGLGVAIAHALAEEGADVAISYVASAEKAQSVVRQWKRRACAQLRSKRIRAIPRKPSRSSRPSCYALAGSTSS